jgi:hypothetical protein
MSPFEPLECVVLPFCEAYLTWRRVQSTSHHVLLFHVPTYFELHMKVTQYIHSKEQNFLEQY